MSQLREAFNQLQNDIEQLKEQYKNLAEKLVYEEIKSFFAKYPTFPLAITWKQYGNRWNDDGYSDPYIGDIWVIIHHDPQEVLSDEEEETLDVRNGESLQDLKEELMLLNLAETDGHARAAEVYTQLCLDKGQSDPFRPYYTYTREQMIRRWSPSYYSIETLENRIESIEQYYSQELHDDVKAVCAAIASIGDEALIALFGTDVKILITPQGVTTIESYSE